tara:strand:- start:72 stop:992 length:921 start_codon:yes stop_codon:yes gene_type:complete
MKKIIKSDKKNNYLVTISIGKQLTNNWKKYIFPSWKMYCKKNGLGLIYFTKDLINKKHPKWKKPTWQKLLIGDTLKNERINNLCYLDTDIMINPFSPNIFSNYNKKKIFASSNIFGLPYDLKNAQKKVVFFRKKYLNKKYPLDSAIFANKKNMYKYSNLPVQKDDLCAGLFIFNLKNHSKLMKKWFHKYDTNYKSLTNGDQVHFSYHVLSSKKFQRLDYKFQAFWIYEMAMNYPFLYFTKNRKIIKECILNTLMNNYFLHFPGSWLEGRMWKNNILNKSNIIFYKNLHQYFKKKVYGKPRGKILQK